jgi:hypothetical protein
METDWDRLIIRHACLILAARVVRRKMAIAEFCVDMALHWADRARVAAAEVDEWGDFVIEASRELARE